MIQTAIDILTKYYNLGTILDAKVLTGGFCNQSFFVTAEKDNRLVNYLVRRYNPRIEEKELIFEHALISHLKKNGFTKVAGLIPQKSGGTYVKENLVSDGRTIPVFWAVFEYLEGEDRYTWIDTHIDLDDMISAAKVLADLHSAGQNFRKPPGADRLQPKILDFMPRFGPVYDAYAQKAGKTKFDKSFLNHHREIAKIIDYNLIPESDLANLPQLPIHCDYHQGNLKYQKSRVIGVFDFDWSKIDLRIFDLGLSLVYFCAVWDGRQAGTLNLDKCNLFIQTYNHACASTATPGRLTQLEKKYLPSMLAAGNLYVLHWTIVDFYSLEGPDDDQYTKFINHGLNLMNWIETQKSHIARTLDPLGA
jgi:homoserine kinase type II